MTTTQAIAKIVEIARSRMPGAHAHKQIAKAANLVAAGKVTLLPNGAASVASQSRPVAYLVTSTCGCEWSQHGDTPCTHRLAKRIAERVRDLTVGPSGYRFPTYR